MQPDSQFVDSYVAAVLDERSADDHDAWVNLRLATDFIRNASATLRAGILVMMLNLALLYQHVSIFGLMVWACLCSAMMAYRFYTVNAFERLYLADATSTKNSRSMPVVGSFFKRHGWGWPVSGIIFAAPAFLYHEQVPPVNEYLCLMILVGMGAIASSLMSAHSRCQREFSHALCGTGLLAVITNWLLQLPEFPSLPSVVMAILIVTFWTLIVYVGKHMHTLQRSSYSAQFGNEQLIRSLRQQTQAATEAVQMKNNLLASAAHDLRQPVHALAFYADWLRGEPQLAETLIPKILVATDSVNTLFNSLFDFARIESGALKVQWAEVSIEELMEEMALQFAPAADKKALYLKTKAMAGVVRSDPVLLRRIVANLLANAIRYTDKGGATMTARVMHDELWLEISDSGVGIEPEHLPHVFKEFYRAPGHEGTADSFGLGLAIVERLCRALGHNVKLQSVQGQGTHCTVGIKLTAAQIASFEGAPTPLSDVERVYTQMMPRVRAQ